MTVSPLPISDFDITLTQRTRNHCNSFAGLVPRRTAAGEYSVVARDTGTFLGERSQLGATQGSAQ